MAGREIRVDVRKVNENLPLRFTWVVQSTQPVEDLFLSPLTFPTRAAAIEDFDRVRGIMGWVTDYEGAGT